MASMKGIATGIQHIGIPTEDIAKTIAFYEKLGFEIAHQKLLHGTQNVAFLKLEDLVLEVYETEKAAMAFGAVDHIAINVSDVAAAHKVAEELGLEIIEEGELPFWANGVKYFTVLGPNKEKVEFNQYL